MPTLIDLGPGADGDPVLLLQDRLAAYGLVAGTAGTFGNDTDLAVRDFQKTHDAGEAKVAFAPLRPLLDGVAMLLPDTTLEAEDWENAKLRVVGGDRPGVADLQSFVDKAAAGASFVRERSGADDGAAKYPQFTFDNTGILTPEITTLQRGPMTEGYHFRRTGVALSGGGSKGDFELGALHYLYDTLFSSWETHRSGSHIVTGTSVGAVNSAKLAEGGPQGLEELERLWFGLRTNSDMYRLASPVDDVLMRALSIGAFAAARAVTLITITPLALVWASARSTSSTTCTSGSCANAPRPDRRRRPPGRQLARLGDDGAPRGRLAEHSAGVRAGGGRGSEPGDVCARRDQPGVRLGVGERALAAVASVRRVRRTRPDRGGHHAGRVAAGRGPQLWRYPDRQLVRTGRYARTVGAAGGPGGGAGPQQ